MYFARQTHIAVVYVYFFDETGLLPQFFLKWKRQFTLIFTSFHAKIQSTITNTGFRCGVIRGNRGCKLGKHGETLVWTCEIPLVNGSGLVGHLYFE